MDKSYSEVAKGHLIRAVIDRSDPDCAISHTNWDIVRRKLMGVFWKVLKENPGPSPQCDDAGWYRSRVKLMACSNERSAMLLKQAIALLDGLWEGARLDVVSIDEIPRLEPWPVYRTNHPNPRRSWSSFSSEILRSLQAIGR